MTGVELQRLRKEMGLDRASLAREIGYTGTDRNNTNRIMWMESGKNQIPLYIARLVWIMHRYHKNVHRLPRWPQWIGYEFTSERNG